MGYEPFVFFFFSVNCVLIFLFFYKVVKISIFFFSCLLYIILINIKLSFLNIYEQRVLHG